MVRVLLATSLSMAIFWSFSNSSAHAQGCNPNYADKCVPNASDVDCAGGNGNGPVYVSGPVRVVGVDVYGFDRDKDGIGCERG